MPSVAPRPSSKKPRPAPRRRQQDRGCCQGGSRAADRESTRTLREQVAALAVKGAEQILRKEVNASVHADLLNRLKTEL
jgi:hypothetical protein